MIRGILSFLAIVLGIFALYYLAILFVAIIILNGGHIAL